VSDGVFVSRHSLPTYYRCSCTSDALEIVRIKCQNGRDQYRLLCPDCRRTPSALSKSLLTDEQREQARLLRDHTDRKEIHPCERCGSIDDVEVHHWAPRSIFDDADDWPTSWLCRPCHREWHRKTGLGLPQRKRVDPAVADKKIQVMKLNFHRGDRYDEAPATTQFWAVWNSDKQAVLRCRRDLCWNWCGAISEQQATLLS
jgi:hypothetical protein